MAAQLPHHTHTHPLGLPALPFAGVAVKSPACLLLSHNLLPEDPNLEQSPEQAALWVDIIMILHLQMKQ